MRLTLRTLLAYLDDLLKPADAREIGRKLTGESPGAKMASRIKDVLRRRRIEAPALDAEPDPNTVAEYLDNLLPDEAVESHERACLGSDELLAETAACHQILTLVMGKPIRVSRELRDRAYALHVVPQPETEEAGQPSAEHAAATIDRPVDRVPAPPVGSVPPVRSHARSTDEDEALPPFLASTREKPSVAWAAGAALAVVGLVVFIAVYQSDESFRRQHRKTVAVVDPAIVDPAESLVGAPIKNDEIKNDESARTDDADVATTDDASDPAKETANASAPAIAQAETPTQAETTSANTTSGETKTGDSAAAAMTTDNASTDSKSAVDANQPDPANAVAKVDTPAIPMTEAKPAPANTATETSETTPKMSPDSDTPTTPATTAPPTAEPPSTEPSPAVVDLMEPYAWKQQGDGLSLHIDEQLGGWSVLPADASISPGDRIITPEPFEGAIVVAEAPLAMRLLTATDLTIAPPTEKTRGGLIIDRGRIVINSNEPTAVATGENEATDSEDADIDNADIDNTGSENTGKKTDRYTKLSIKVGANTVVVAMGPGSQVAIDIETVVPNQIDKDARLQRIGTMFITRGPVTVTQPNATDEADAIAASEQDPLIPRSMPLSDPSNTAVLADTPEWVANLEQSALTRRYAALYRKLIPTDRAVLQDLRAVLKDPKYRTSQLAAATLSLIKEPEPLVEGLGSVHEETRIESIEGLRFWLAESPERIDELEKFLSSIYRDETLAEIVRLVAGYSESDLQTEITSERLLRDLGDSEIAIRELAFFHIQRLTEKTYDYQPNANQSSRDVAIRRWRDHVNREGSLIPATKAIDKAPATNTNPPQPTETATPEPPAPETPASEPTTPEPDAPSQTAPATETPPE